MDVDETNPPAEPSDDRRREIEELKFLVGTSCSRLINLLTDGATPAATLAAEAAFMGERATRLAELLEATASDGGGS
ncbi:MAG: hypothetical protein ACYC6T_15855 [Thermoleophilia bacterium]